MERGLKMQICCTEKVFKLIEHTPVKLDEGVDLFAWTVNVVIVNRKQMLVVMNDATRAGFVLYGVKAKELKNLETTIIAGITQMFQQLQYSETIIQAYFLAAGQVKVSKTRGRIYTAGLTSMMRDLDYTTAPLYSDRLFQPAWTQFMNTHLVTKDKKYIYPYEELKTQMLQFGKRAQEQQAFELEVTLDLDKLQPKRKIIVPANWNFAKLHEAIQAAFAWENYHLHEFDFTINAEKYWITDSVTIENSRDYGYDDELTIIDDKTVTLAEYLSVGMKVIYTYDFGDYWRHHIEVLKQDIMLAPVCTHATGRRALEDIGGVGGFELFLEKLTKHESMENAIDDTDDMDDMDDFEEMDSEELTWLDDRAEAYEQLEPNIETINQSLEMI